MNQMIDTVYKYEAYCRHAKSLALCLEQLIEERDYHNKNFNITGEQRSIEQIEKVRDQLDTLWSIQIDLYFLIHPEETKP